MTSSQDECGGTLFIRENPQKCDYFNVPWQSRNVRSVEIDSDYIEPLEKIVRCIVELSPVRKVYILVRRQCRGENNIIGMLTVGQYVDLMRVGKLLGNVAYVVYEPESDS